MNPDELNAVERAPLAFIPHYSMRSVYGQGVRRFIQCLQLPVDVLVRYLRVPDGS